MDENTVQETVSATTNAVAATSKVMKKDKIIIGALFAATIVVASVGTALMCGFYKNHSKKKKASAKVSEEK